jgi:hypothetical protein
MIFKWFGDKTLLKDLGDFDTHMTFNGDNIILRHDNVAGKVVIQPGDCIQNINRNLVKVACASV